jgi:iron complex outermembrane receptor protein
MRKAVLCAGASAATLVLGDSAQAQAPQTNAVQPSNPSAGAQPDRAEIVITARRRSENLMKTAISGSVLTGSDLANKGVVTVDSLQFAAPSITVNNFGQGNDFNIRGIGKAEHNTQTETGVITYRDGVPAFPGYFTEEPYYDVANIQVLRGPQGTVVGQNATGGAVFVNTNDPDINGGYHGYITANYGNYNDIGVQGAINLPISSTFAARVAFYGQRRDSFYHITGPGGTAYPYNPGDQRLYAGRISLLWKPTARLSIRFKTDLDYLNMGAYPADPYSDRFKYFPVGSTTPNPDYTDLFDITANSPMKARDKFFRSNLRIEYEFVGGIKFRSTSGLARGNSLYLTDLDGTATGVNGNPFTSTYTFGDTFIEHQFSQEFNLISPDDQRFTWLVGAFGLWDKDIFAAPYKLFIYLPSLGIPNYYDLQGTVPKRSLAVFGQVGYNITPNLKLELGGRYTASRATNHVLIRNFGFIVTPDEQSTKSTNFSYKASLGWTVNRNNYLYGFVATGFRPGGLNTPDYTNATPPPPFGPEKVRSFEAGWKATLLDGHLRTTVDGFYNQYKGFQAILGRPNNPRVFTELNVPGNTKIYGGEVEAELKIGSLSLDVGANVLHSELGQFYAVDQRNPPPAVPAPGLCDPATGPATPYCINLTGRRQTYAPNVTFNASAQYDFRLGGNDMLTPRVNYGYVGSQWATLFENPALGDRLGARKILNAQLAWQHSSWTVTAYGTNLTNQHYVGSLNSSLDFAGPPRQYGIKVQKVF